MKEEIENKLKPVIDFFGNKKVQNVIIIVLFLSLLIFTSMIRLQNLPLLVDQTTGENIPLALDPFYFLRVAETLSETGSIPEVDLMRYPSLQVGFSNEILPNIVVFLHKMVSSFDSEITLQYIFVISPVIFFVLGLIAFFFLILVLTKSKWIALLSSFFLAIIPTYLYRTMAGFADHESIGMFAFFLALLCYSLAIKYLDKEENKLIKAILFGLLVGISSAFVIACWGGVAGFIFMIIPLSFGLFWLIKVRNSDKKTLFNFLIFYLAWFLSSILFSLIFGFDLYSVTGKIFLSSGSLINGFVLLFIIVDYLIIKFGDKILEMREKLKKYRVLVSLLITSILGGILLSLYGTNLLSFIPNLINQLFSPFGRTGLTVAENLQPYLMDWINQISKVFFWIFFVGMVFVGIEISRGVQKKKNKIWFAVVWVIMISSILFSRISAISPINGTNFLSSFVYFGGLLLFFGYCVYLYFNDEIKVKSGIILISSWLFFILIGGRSSIRLLFVVTPLVCFMSGYAFIKLFEYAKKSKDNILKFFLFLGLIAVLIGLVISSFSFITSINQQAKYTGPSANYQWQGAMSWVKDTPESSIFVHWWDYGYWVQTLGERATITDGGHAVGYWDHLIGRYVLTTPKPETALSFMKSQEVDYLLIDPTDLGKYSAYSKIGSGPKGEDRFASIPIMHYDTKQIQETRDGMTFIYQGGTFVDEDIIYREGDKEIFLPSKQASIIGIIFGTNKSMLNQPIGVFLYNDHQIHIPLRYVYINHEIIDFQTGIDSVVSIMPKVSQIGQQLNIDNFGTAIYLSPKVKDSLFAQLYLLDDVFNNYPTMKVAHSEQDMAIIELNNQGANIGDRIYFNGFRSAIKIWEVNYPDNILVREEFLRTKGEFAEFDNLTFVE